MTNTIRVGIVGATVTQGGSSWGQNAHVPALTLSPTGLLAATGSYDRTVRLWDLRDAQTRILTLGPGLFGNVAADPPFRYKTEVTTREQRQIRLVRVFHYRLLRSM